MYSFLVKRAVVACSREVGALGRLSKPYSSFETLELSFLTIKRDRVVVGSQSEACFDHRD
jgi:hypothetical protein